MRPLVITGTCKELHKCAKLLERFGYIPNSHGIPSCDNHEGGFLILNCEGEFGFYMCNWYSNLDYMVTASDFFKKLWRARYTQSVQYKEFLFCLYVLHVSNGVRRKLGCRSSVAAGIFLG